MKVTKTESRVFRDWELTFGMNSNQNEIEPRKFRILSDYDAYMRGLTPKYASF
jgi:hypothetical protein